MTKVRIDLHRGAGVRALLAALVGALLFGTLLAGVALANSFSFSGSLTVGDPTQTARLFRNAVPSTCAAPKVSPGPTSSGPRAYDKYQFVNAAAAGQCVTVVLTCTAEPCVQGMFATAYSSFDPANVAANYIADAGLSPTNVAPTPFSFNVAAGQSFEVVIAQVEVAGINGAYTLDVSTPGPGLQDSSGGGGGANPTLTVARVGAGTGSVTSSPAGINCPPDCSETSTAPLRSRATAVGTTYVLTAHPAAGSTFGGWFGACAGVTGPCVVSLYSDTMIVAKFDLGTSPTPTPTPTPTPPPPAPGRFDLHASTAGKGTVVSDPVGIDCGQSCTATFDESVLITLTATPQQGWTLKRWRYGCSGNDPVCTIEMSSNRRAKAIFVKL